MKHSCNYNGQVLDFKFAKREVDQLFYIGDILVGTIFRMDKGNWSAVSLKQNEGWPTAIRNLRSRYSAAECLLKMNGYWR